LKVARTLLSELAGVIVTLPRQVLPGSFYKITRRCTQRQFLLRPDEVTNNVFAYCLGEAAERFEIDVLMTTAESNHHHTDIFDRHGNVIAFVERFHKLVAKALNAHRGRWENFWSCAAPSIVRLEDRQAVIDAMVYTALNPVKDGLVARVREWPGVNGLCALLERRSLRARRPAHFFRADGPMPEEVALEIRVPRELGDVEAVRDEVRARVHETEARLADERRRTGRHVVGARAIRRQNWSDSPSTSAPRRTRQPRTGSRHLASWLLARIRAREFLGAYRAARQRWLEGSEAVFPAGTYWLQRFAGVRVSPLQS
jgi:hypothetical protein